jgi:gluconolactonase
VHLAARSLASFLLLSGACVCAQAQETTPAIAGVVQAGTPIQLVKDGFEAVEGPVGESDGGVLFSNARLNRVLRIAPDGALSVWYEGAGGANGLTRTTKGEIVGTLTEGHAIGVLQPGASARVLVGSYQGTPFNRPNDLVADRRGNIYFTDTSNPTVPAPASLPAGVYQLTAKGTLVRITADIARPNGVALSPDERTLYVADTGNEWVYAFSLDRKGNAGARREFAKLALPPAQTGTPAPIGGGADGLAVDEKGRLYVAATLGVQVFSPHGVALGTIVLPKQPQNLAFSGPRRSVLFVVGRGAVYRIATQTHGRRGTGK